MAWERFYKKDFDGALELFDAAREGHNDPSANFGRACALFRISDHEGALAELGGLIRADSKNAAAYHTRAMIYGADEHYEKALKDLQKVTSLQPDNMEAWCDLGGVYLTLSKYAEAAECFERSAGSGMGCSCAWLGKALVALYQKQYKKSVEYLNIAIKQDASQPLAHMARAEVYFLTGRAKEGAKDMGRALLLDKDFFEKFKLSMDEDVSDEQSDDSDEDTTLSDDSFLRDD